MTGVLRRLLAQRPFRPFRLVLTGGTEVPVGGRDRVTFPRGDMRIDREDGRTVILDPNHLVEIKS